jgi:hypothetical protein
MRRPYVVEGRARLSFQRARAEEHVDSRATSVVVSDFRERALRQFDCHPGVIPAKVGQVEKHLCTQRSGRNLVRERRE